MCLFMASNLAGLARNLTTAHFYKFREVAKVFTPTEMPLVTRKAVFPKEFYSALTETHESDVDYEYAALVCNRFYNVRAKSYAYDIENATTIRAKGIRGPMIRNHLTFDDNKRCLFAVDDDDDDTYRDNVSIRSFKHQVKIIKTMKLTFNRSDDKRQFVISNIKDNIKTVTGLKSLDTPKQ
ncbi:uncharacterized protein LOC113557640, partial [Rhopalosiphum maidis]|uniref:uncharacterized protein LOC113557640 n=1 Tax=Rhopalosiphum maidis TaxID=43146 RepID=UPI000F007FE4